jgi:uncharacterized caspase-like protein
VSCSYHGQLRKTAEDAKLVGDALKASGFEVTSETDLNHADLYRQVGRLASRMLDAGPAAVGVVYFAGYGASNGQQKNFLVPNDMLPKPEDLEDGALSLEDIVKALLPAQAAASVVLVDCGREYVPNSTKDKEGGFATQYGKKNVLLAFATEAKQVRPKKYDSDVSPYARILAEEIRNPARRGLEEMLKVVSVRVSADTNGAMTPRLLSTLNENGTASDPVGTPIYFRLGDDLDIEPKQ